MNESIVLNQPADTATLGLLAFRAWQSKQPRPYVWYLQREPRKLIVGPKGYSDGKDYFEIGNVSFGAGYQHTEGIRWFAFSCEGITHAARLGLKFGFADVISAINYREE